MSINTSALSQEGLKVFDFDIQNDLKAPWKEYSETIRNLITQKDPKMRRRFRRLIPIEKIVKLSDMLYGLTSEELYKNTNKRL